MHLNSPFVDSETGQPSYLLIDLFKILGLDHTGDLQSFYQISQKHFLRPKDRQRWEIVSCNFDNQFENVHEIFQEIGLIHEIKPKRKIYDNIFIHGAIFTLLRPRIKYLDKLWEMGIRANNIIVICSDRPLSDVENPITILDPTKSTYLFRDDWKAPETLPTNQIEVSKLIWDQMITQEELRKKSVQFLTIPKIMDVKTGQLVRYANTQDTIEGWLNNNPHPGSILAISNNPYVGYQHAKLRNVLYKLNPQNVIEGSVGSIHFETVGFGSHSNLPLIIYLDTIARWLDTDLELLSTPNSASTFL